MFLKISQNSQEITCEFYEITKNAFSTEHIHKTASEFLPKDIDKFKECQTNESTKKNHLRRKKRKAWNRGKQTQMPVYVRVKAGLRVLQGSSVTDV